jgi:RHS repeat-associated protein
MWFRAEVTPSSWVSSSVMPTLVVPGASGAWTFKVSDLSDGTSSFGTRTYSESGSSARIPAGLLQNGSVYTWVAESPGQTPVGGSFTVDVQLRDVQHTDAAAGVGVALSSGEASYMWTSHSMASLGGPVGIALRFQGSNRPSSGVPAGWVLTSSSGSPYESVVTRPDGSVGLVAKNGQVSSYRRGAGRAWNPVKMAGDGLDASGLAPVLIENADGSWSVTSKASTSRFVDDNGDGTANLAGVSADGAPMLQQDWSGGLLRSITDPVSGRSVELVYGGGSCPAPVRGFVAAPEGMLCRVKFWDGSTAAVSYVALPDGSVSIGRLVDFPEAGGDGAQVSDVAYDAAGRIARTRSPLVAAAAASGVVAADDAQFWGEVVYAPDGRVATATDLAPSVGAVRCARSYQTEGTITAVSDSCLGRMVTMVAFDATTFFPLEVTDVTGRISTTTWDFPTGNLLRSVDATGRVMLNTFVDGNLVQTRGPSRDLITAPATVREYDESYATSSEGVAMRGLDVIYWPSATDRGPDAVQELGPTRDGELLSSLTVNWDASPAGNRSGGWSAMMTGTLTIDTAGTYSFASSNSTARLRIANTACEDSGCQALELPAGAVSIQVDVSASASVASMDLTWSGPDTGGVSKSIPTDRLRPQYGFVTETKIVDPTAVRANSDNISRSVYSNPSKGIVTAHVNGAGSSSAISYEGSGWNRPTASVLPAGNAVRQTWWGDKESATAPCPGAKASVQGGASKQSITPGSDGGEGPSAQQWYVASGALAATRLSGGATQCLDYDRAGRLIEATTLGLESTSRLTIDYAVGGNPLVASTTETRGDVVTTSTVEIDLAGRPVRSVDRYGIVTLTTYDTRTGAVATTTSTPPGAAPVVTAFAYDEFARPTTTTIDGRAVAVVGYGALGLPDAVTYGNGAVSRVSFDAQDRPVAATTSVAGRTYTSAKTLSAAGVTSSLSLSGEGLTSTFDFSHDTNGRLSTVAVSAGLVAEARTWTYGYDANSNRTSQTITIGSGAPVTLTSTYDTADRLVATTDPTIAGPITYDESGNATQVGADRFTYDAVNRLVSATDGTTTVSYERSVTGAVLAKTTTDANGTATIRFGSGGFVLDEQGRPALFQAALPGGVQFTRPIGSAAATWDFSSVTGDRFFTLDDAGNRAGAMSVFTPFGERLGGVAAVEADRPALAWRATEGNETIALTLPVVSMGARVYMPALGRFLQIDPVVGGSANGYDYADQNPTSSSDPSGNAIEDRDWIGALVVAVAAVAATFLAPARFGARAARVTGALVGIMAGAFNLVVQNVLGGDPLVGLASILTGVLAGVAAGSIVGKVRYAKWFRATGGPSGYEVVTSMRPSEDMFDHMLREFGTKAVGNPGRMGVKAGLSTENAVSLGLPKAATGGVHESVGGAIGGHFSDPPIFNFASSTEKAAIAHHSSGFYNSDPWIQKFMLDQLESSSFLATK